MKNAVSALALLASLASANAADLTSPLSLSAKDILSTPVTNWTGFYAGIHGGYTEADLGFKAGTPGQKEMGAFGGGQFGYNYQLSNQIVLGLEADVSAGDLSDKVHDGTAITQTSSLDAFGSARVRVGYAAGSFLPYVTGGLAWGGVTVGEACPAGATAGHCHTVGPYSVDTSNTEIGWVVGGGLEYAMTQHVSLRVEYLHADLGSETFNLGAVASARSPEVTADLVRLGVNYRF